MPVSSGKEWFSCEWHNSAWLSVGMVWPRGGLALHATEINSSERPTLSTLDREGIKF